MVGWDNYVWGKGSLGNFIVYFDIFMNSKLEMNVLIITDIPGIPKKITPV